MNIEIRDILQMHIKGKITEERNGASGTVYIVDNGENCHPRIVAYKSFQERFALDEEKKHQFLTECIKWFKIRNHYLLTPFYAIVCRGQPFMCMQYCEKDLKSLMLEMKFNNAEALVISCQIIKALLSIEKKGFKQHQDLNPPNILLKDLNVDFPGYPSNNLINYEVYISDFGMLDLYNNLGPSKGAIGGKFPFKAPEQYSKEELIELDFEQEKYEQFKPDTFAVGVIIYMLFTNNHPNGLTVSKALNKNTSSSYFKKWAFSNPEINLPDRILSKLITDCLNTNPSNRPNLDKLLEHCLSILENSDLNAYENLLLRFNENDKWEKYIPRLNYLHTLKNIAELPEQRTEILAYLFVILEEQKCDVQDPNDIIYYCEILSLIVQLAKKRDGIEDRLVSELYLMIDLIKKENKNLKVKHKYASHNDDGEYMISSPKDVRDIEVSCNYIGLAIQVLEKMKSEQLVLDKFASLNDKILMSMYYYYKASEVRHKDINKMEDFLNLAKENNPMEIHFDIMKNLWIEMHKLFLDSQGL